jgi:hypothetical protein
MSKNTFSLCYYRLLFVAGREKKTFNQFLIQAVPQQNVEKVKGYEYFLKALYDIIT